MSVLQGRSGRRLVLAGIAASIVAGCADPPLEVASTVLYQEHVAPILAAHCVQCHHAGGIGPFPLQTYADAVQQAELIRTVTAAREMPPFHIDNSGDCNRYVDANTLTDDQIATIGAWVDQGMAQGDAALGVTLEPPVDSTLREVSVTLDMGVDYLPSASLDHDDYRCFVVDLAPDQDKFLTAFQVRPGNAREVHHIVMFSFATPEVEAAAVALDAEEEGPGYSCFGSDRVQADPIAGWAPGSAITRFPEGTGIRIPAGRKALLSMHYSLESGQFPDRTRIDLELQDAIEQEAFITAPGAFLIFLPPGQPSASTSQDVPILIDRPLDVPLQVWGVFPHLHDLGRTMRAEVVGGGDTGACLLNVPDWDYHWQRFYFYDAPILVLPGEDLIRTTCSYDTTGRTEPVEFGDNHGDEMCLAELYVTRP